MAGSLKPAPPGRRLRRVSRDERVEASLYLRPGPPPAGAAPGEAGYRTVEPEELARDRRARHRADQERVERWASAQGLAVTRRDSARRLVKVAGPARRIEEAFGTRLHHYRDGERRFRGRIAALRLPAELETVVDAALGLDTRPLAEPQIGPLGARGPRGGYLPSQFASAYNFPVTPGLGAGQTIALIMFGGGYLERDLDLAFAAMGRAKPSVVSEGVSGGFNNFADTDNNREVALDIQVAGGLAPGAAIVAYFAPNTGAGWVDALSRAVHDPHHRPTVISISWAQSETVWAGQFAQHRRQVGLFLEDAARLGISVVAASGDTGGTWRSTSEARVGYPASDPLVCGCGGTMLAGGTPRREVVWNRPPVVPGDPVRASGGGVSRLFPLPAYQAQAAVPPHATAGGTGRGVPDVAALSDDLSGYRVVVDGQEFVAEGTSAAAPLWAALVARINEAKGRPAGFFLPRAYANAAAFNDIADGNNRVGGIGYAARPGWDPCTGLGSPDGMKLLAVL